VPKENLKEAIRRTF